MPSPRAITKSSSAVLERDRPADQVLDHRVAVVGHPQADRRARLVAGLAAVGGAAVRLLPGAHVLGGRRVAVGRAGLDSSSSALAVALAALGLASGPSSQSSSSQRSASRICSTFSGVERSRSVSSIRSTSAPPEPRAASQL